MGRSTIVGIGYLLCFVLALGLKLWSPPAGALGYAPLDVLGQQDEPITIEIWYGTEKEAWLAEAARRFEASGAALDGRPVQVVLTGMGSREIAQRVAARDWGASAPAAISPASSLWIEVLTSDWATRHGGSIVHDDQTWPLVLTPLVVVAWQERAELLWPDQQADFWGDIHDALADQQGWAGVARRNGISDGDPAALRAAEWGLVKFGHTSPLLSNSGAQTLLLLAYSYHDTARGLSESDVLDPGFQQWMEEMEDGVLEFGESTGTFMDDMVRFGPGKYDLVVVYENLAIRSIEAAQGRWGPIRIYYPPATLISDHPYAILQDPVTTPEQRAAAALFGDFLLSQPIQELALQEGFRPADPNVAVMNADEANPFNRYARYGVSVDIRSQVEVPSGPVLSTLLESWRRRIGR